MEAFTYFAVGFVLGWAIRLLAEKFGRFKL